jgi:hypothetical protein
MAWDDLRTSKAFPVIVGGLAGAGIGVALLFIASRLRAPKKALPAAYDANGNPMNVVYLPAPAQPRILGFTVGDLITLGTTGFALFRQVQSLRQEQALKQEAAQLPELSTLPPAAEGEAKVSHKKK